MTKLLLSANTDWYLYNFRLSLAKYLRECGFEVVLVSPPGEYVQKLEEQGFRWIRWDVGRQSVAPWRELPSLRRIYSVYRQEKPDFVHHHTVKPVLYGTFAARMAGVPSVINSITGRGYIFLGEGTKAQLLRQVIKPIYRMALNFPGSGVTFENEHDQRYFIENHLVSEGHTWLIEGVGVDPERFKPKPEPEGVPVILMASRMLWDKGVGVLVEAARIMKSRVPARIALVGEPDPGNPATVTRETLEKWDAEGIVEWWGWQAEMPEIYHRSHIVTLPTMYGEGVPTTLLEGAACGRPLVATNIPGCRQAVIQGQNGFLVPPDDPKALVEALIRLVSDPALRGRMGEASRQLVLKKFTQSQVNVRTLQVYQQVSGTRGGMHQL